MTLALLFPGQGPQRAGLLSELPGTTAASRAKTEAVSVVQSLGVDPATLDHTDSLRRTTEVQLTLLIAGLVTARALIEDHRLDVGIVAGHSIGAFAAAVTAGVLTVQERSRSCIAGVRACRRPCRMGAGVWRPSRG